MAREAVGRPLDIRPGGGLRKGAEAGEGGFGDHEQNEAAAHALDPSPRPQCLATSRGTAGRGSILLAISGEWERGRACLILKPRPQRRRSPTQNSRSKPSARTFDLVKSYGEQMRALAG